jgi:hypothetical protein
MSLSNVGSSKSLRRGLSGDFRGFAQNLRGRSGLSAGGVPTSPVLSGGKKTAPLRLHLAARPNVSTNTNNRDFTSELLGICIILETSYSTSPDCMLQGHSKIVQRYNTNSGAQASEDNSELTA